MRTLYMLAVVAVIAVAAPNKTLACHDHVHLDKAGVAIDLEIVRITLSVNAKVFEQMDQGRVYPSNTLQELATRSKSAASLVVELLDKVR